MPQFGIFPVFSSQKLTSNFLSQKRDVLCFDLKCDNPGCEIYNKIFFLAQKRLIFNGVHEHGDDQKRGYLICNFIG